MRTALLLFLLFGVFLAGPAHADVKEETRQVEDILNEELRPAILEVNYERLEDTALFYRPKEGSLGRDLWTKTRRSALTSLIGKLEHPGSSPVMQKLTYGLLFSRADSDLIENDIEIEPGKDILTLRLNKALELGLYDKVFEIYSDLNGEPYHPDLAKAGMLSMLLSGEKSLACLDYKIIEDRDFEGSFWEDIDAYCDMILEDRKPDSKKLHSQVLKKIIADPSYKMRFANNDLSKLSIFELALLNAEERFNYPQLSSSFISQLAPRFIVLAGQKPEISESEKFRVLERRVALGQAEPEKLEEYFINNRFPQNYYDDDGFVQLEKLKNSQKLRGLYQNFSKAKKDKQKEKFFLDAIKLTNWDKLTTLAPFAEDIRTIEKRDFNRSLYCKMALVLHNHNKLHLLFPEDEKTENNKALGNICSILPIIYTGEIDDKNKNFQKTHIEQALKRIKDPGMKKFLKTIIENVDKYNSVVHNAPIIYGNDLDLTLHENYVMPSVSVWDRLRNSSSDQRIGETVLLSTLVLNESNSEKKLLYPGFFRNLMDSLRAVGLNRISQDIAVEALLRNSKQ